MEVESAVKIFLSSADIGIIGGADGPTAVFVARSAFQWLGIVALLLLCSAVFLILRRAVKRKKQSDTDRHKS